MHPFQQKPKQKLIEDSDNSMHVSPVRKSDVKQKPLKEVFKQTHCHLQKLKMQQVPQKSS